MITDTHAHVWWKSFADDRDEVLQRAREAGVSRMVIVATDLERFVEEEGAPVTPPPAPDADEAPADEPDEPEADGGDDADEPSDD